MAPTPHARGADGRCRSGSAGHHAAQQVMHSFTAVSRGRNSLDVNAVLKGRHAVQRRQAALQQTIRRAPEPIHAPVLRTGVSTSIPGRCRGTCVPDGLVRGQDKVDCLRAGHLPVCTFAACSWRYRLRLSPPPLLARSVTSADVFGAALCKALMRICSGREATSWSAWTSITPSNLLTASGVAVPRHTVC